MKAVEEYGIAPAPFYRERLPTLERWEHRQQHDLLFPRSQEQQQRGETTKANAVKRTRGMHLGI